MELLNKFTRILNAEEDLGDEPIETPRHLKELIDDIGDDLLIHEDPLQIYLTMENMMELAGEIKNKVKDEAMIQLKEEILTGDEKTTEYLGNSITLTTTPVFDYPEDPQINQYSDEMRKLEETYKPRMKTLSDAIKTRQKQLQLNGDAKEVDTKHQLRIKKK